MYGNDTPWIITTDWSCKCLACGVAQGNPVNVKRHLSMVGKFREDHGDCTTLAEWATPATPGETE